MGPFLLPAAAAFVLFSAKGWPPPQYYQPASGGTSSSSSSSNPMLSGNTNPMSTTTSSPMIGMGGGSSSVMASTTRQKAHSAMEVWIDVRTSSVKDGFLADADRILGTEYTRIQNNNLLEGSKAIGKVIDVSTPQGQEEGLQATGSVDWILAWSSSQDWKMIPAENLISTAKRGGTRIAFYVDTLDDVMGLALGLQVDALCLRAEAPDEFFNAAFSAKMQREKQVQQNPVMALQQQQQQQLRQPSQEGRMVGDANIVVGSCRRNPKTAVLADRVVIDLVQSLTSDQGCWVGSSERLTALILSELPHSQTSSVVGTKSFRVNAGPVSSLVVMGDGKTTKYLGDIDVGDSVCVYDSKTGETRSVAVGRLAIETRPCVMATLETNDGQESQVFLQQAETVRLGGEGGAVCRVTELSQNDSHSVLLRAM